MKHKIVTIRDIKTNTYFVPQFVRSVGGFLRQLSDEINSPQQTNTLADTMSKHPEDFEVFEIGEWDDTDGSFDTPHDASHTMATQLCVLSSLKK